MHAIGMHLRQERAGACKILSWCTRPPAGMGRFAFARLASVQQMQPAAVAQRLFRTIGNNEHKELLRQSDTEQSLSFLVCGSVTARDSKLRCDHEA
eukprot:6179699-Pleurochrysis_carterae.AAC.4